MSPVNPIAPIVAEAMISEDANTVVFASETATDNLGYKWTFKSPIITTRANAAIFRVNTTIFNCAKDDFEERMTNFINTINFDGYIYSEELGSTNQIIAQGISKNIEAIVLLKLVKN